MLSQLEHQKTQAASSKQSACSCIPFYAGCARCKQGERTRNPRTGLPPGSLQTRGTTTTDVSSSHTLSIRPSSPCGISGHGSCFSAPTTASFACVTPLLRGLCTPRLAHSMMHLESSLALNSPTGRSNIEAMV